MVGFDEKYNWSTKRESDVQNCKNQITFLVPSLVLSCLCAVAKNVLLILANDISQGKRGALSGSHLFLCCGQKCASPPPPPPSASDPPPSQNFSSPPSQLSQVKKKCNNFDHCLYALHAVAETEFVLSIVHYNVRYK